jgi:hypothetical protein
VDYFLSNEDLQAVTPQTPENLLALTLTVNQTLFKAEIPDADSFYTERLIRLPGMGTYLTKPEVLGTYFN